MKMKKTVLAAAALAAFAAFPQQDGRTAFLKQQAYAEMQRVTGQIDVLQQSHEDLAERVARIEGGKGELGAVKADVASLRAEIDSLRRDMKRMQQEIVSEMTRKVAELVKANNASVLASASAAAETAVRSAQQQRQAQATAGQGAGARGPCQEYVVSSGDTLSLIAQAFSTSVHRIKELNGLKNDVIRPGQKLLVPKK